MLKYYWKKGLVSASIILLPGCNKGPSPVPDPVPPLPPHLPVTPTN